jgi:DNA polymerase IV
MPFVHFPFAFRAARAWASLISNSARRSFSGRSKKLSVTYNPRSSSDCSLSILQSLKTHAVNPDLRGKPVAVGGSRERGVVAAASYEARKFGVRSAMPSVTAKRQCPDLIFVKPRFEVYKAVSQQIREIFAEHTPIIEPLSLDEAYLDVTENLQKIPLARDVALAIRAKIKEVTGLNASAGISYNKFLAKLASDHRKPNGQYVITPEMGPAFVEALPVGKFHGIGPATSAKMNSLGLYTGLDMRNQSLEFMQANFGKAGGYYYWISRGVDNREVRADRIRKSVGAENTFSTDLTEFDTWSPN